MAGSADRGRDDRKLQPVRNTSKGPADAVIQAGSVQGGVHFHGAERPPEQIAIPRQLPASPASFTGRGRELDLLSRAGMTDSSVPIFAIAGAGGIGKTWLALRWAHANSSRFPDGQLYVDLRGYHPSGAPMPPNVAVRGFLDALGVQPGGLPADPHAQVGRYRSLVAGKRMLIVLDNARDSAHISKLLPGSPSCSVVVTSRSPLAGLVTSQGARSLVLDVFSEDEAHGLLSSHIGAERVEAEPEAAAELLRWCGGLPLAVSIIGARAAAQPKFPLSELAEELHERSARLDALDIGDMDADLRTVFSCSYQALSAKQAAAFRLLGLAPPAEVSLPAAASLVGVGTARTRPVLRALVSANLLQEHQPGRFRMHDLVHLYAAELAEENEPVEERRAARRRFVDFYLHTAFVGDRLLDPFRQPIALEPPAGGAAPLDFDGDRTAAVEWFDTEQASLLGAQRLALGEGLDSATVSLAWTLRSFYRLRGRRHDSLAVWQLALQAAVRQGDAAAEASSRLRLGGVYGWLSEHAKAREHIERARRLYTEIGDTPFVAHSAHTLAQTVELSGEHYEALGYAEEAARLYRELEEPAWEALALSSVGRYQAALGRFDQAHATSERALDASRRFDYPIAEAFALAALGAATAGLGRPAEALTHYTAAVRGFEVVSDTHQQAAALTAAGDIQHAQGSGDQARESWRRAFELYTRLNRTADARAVRERLAEVGDDSGGEEGTDGGSGASAP